MRKTNVKKDKANTSTLTANNSSLFVSSLEKTKDSVNQSNKKEVFALPQDCSDIFSRLIKIKNQIGESGKPLLLRP